MGIHLNDYQNARTGDQAWVFLAEIWLPEFLRNIGPGDEEKQDRMDHLPGELEIPPECLLNLKQVLSAFASEAAVRFNQKKIAIPVSFRLFCQKKIIDEQMNGGWSYFLIERTKGSSKSSSGISQHFVDLYFYKEGE